MIELIYKLQEIIMTNLVFTIPTVLKVILIAAVAFPFSWWFSNLFEQRLKKQINSYLATLASRVLFYVSNIAIVLYLLPFLGIQISGILGAAGILGIGLGFAAQTSISNIISGIFLIMEDSFEIGDKIMFDNKIGTVDSITIFSVCLHTDDNKLLRIPNEALLKNSFINLTYFPNRRIDIKITLPNEVKTANALEIIQDVLKSNNHFLSDPAPSCYVKEIKSNAVIIEVQAWGKKVKVNESYAQFVNHLKKRFEKEHIIGGITISN